MVLCGWFEVSSGQLTVVDRAGLTDRDDWQTFDVPPGSRIEVHMPSTDGVPVRWGYLSLGEPEALVTRIACGLTTAMLPSPHFTVEFNADGIARWHGAVCVAPLGDHEANVGRATFRRLARLVAVEGIVDLGPETTSMTCVPIVTIDVERAGVTYRVSRTGEAPPVNRVLEACQRAAARVGWVMLPDSI